MSSIGADRTAVATALALAAVTAGPCLAGGGGFLDRGAPLVEAIPYGTSVGEPREPPDAGRAPEPRDDAQGPDEPAREAPPSTVAPGRP